MKKGCDDAMLDDKVGRRTKHVCMRSRTNQRSRPSATGIELIEFGGITPTSVTTAVMLVGGVRSYNGLRISRLGRLWSINDSRGFVRGNEENKSPIGAAWRGSQVMVICDAAMHDPPSSFLVKLSSCTPSEYLYVSQHTTTGTECCRAIMATRAVPALEKTEPFEWIEWAPTRTIETSLMTEPRAGKRRYVH